jgi:hypothetical protein
MKKANLMLITILLLTAMIITGFDSSDNQRNFRKIMKRYRDEEGFFALSIPTSLIKILIPEDEKETEELFEDIKKVRFLVYERGPTSSTAVTSCKNDLEGLFNNGLYIDLLTISDNSEIVKIGAIPDGDNLLKGLTVFVYNKNQLVAVNFVGRTDLKKIKRLVDNTVKLDSGQPYI